MRRCKHCGARFLIPRSGCDYCGTPVGQGFEYPVQGPEQAKDSPSGFEHLLQHPDLARVIEEGPRAKVPKKRERHSGGGFVLLIFLVLMLRKTGGLSRLQEGPGIIILIAVVLVGLSIRRKRARERAYPGTHLESLPSRLLEFSPESVSPGRRPLKVLIELASGERRRLQFRGEGADLWKTGDYGVAHIKANVLVEFRRLKV